MSGMDLLELLDRTTAENGWMDAAACAWESPELFVRRDPAEQIRGDDLDRALAVCDRCPVQDRCDAYATEHGETGAIWGGVLR